MLPLSANSGRSHSAIYFVPRRFSFLPRHRPQPPSPRGGFFLMFGCLTEVQPRWRTAARKLGPAESAPPCGRVILLRGRRVYFPSGLLVSSPRLRITSPAQVHVLRDARDRLPLRSISGSSPVVTNGAASGCLISWGNGGGRASPASSLAAQCGHVSACAFRSASSARW